MGFAFNLNGTRWSPRSRRCTVQPCLWDGNVHWPLRGEEGTGGGERRGTRSICWSGSVSLLLGCCIQQFLSWIRHTLPTLYPWVAHLPLLGSLLWTAADTGNTLHWPTDWPSPAFQAEILQGCVGISAQDLDSWFASRFVWKASGLRLSMSLFQIPPFYNQRLTWTKKFF